MKTKLIALIIIGVIISAGAGYFYDQMYDCLFPPMWMKFPRTYSMADCLQMYADGTLPDWTKAREDYAAKESKKILLIERFKDESEVEAFYAKYDDANVSIRDDHVSYFVGNDDDFQIRMNLYFDENFERTHMRFFCFYEGEVQYEKAQEDILNHLQNNNCLTYKTGE